MVGSIVPALGDVVDSSLDLVGSELVSTTTEPIVDLADDIVMAVPVTDSLLGPAPIASFIDPITGSVDDVLGSVSDTAAPILGGAVDAVDGAVDPVTGEVLDPILGEAIDPVPVDRPAESGGPIGPSIPVSASTPASATTATGSAASVTRGTSTASAASFRSGPSAPDSAADELRIRPFTPGVPFSPAAPSASSAASSSAGVQTNGSIAVATIEDGIDFRLTAARLALADDDSTPFSLSNDPGSSPD